MVTHLKLLTLVYKVRTGRTGFVEKCLGFAPLRNCEGKLVSMASAYLNTLELIMYMSEIYQLPRPQASLLGRARCVELWD